MSTSVDKHELDLMRAKEQSFKQKLSKVIRLTYQCVAVEPQQYNRSLREVLESIKCIDPKEKDLSQYDELILGKLQGKPSTIPLKEVIQQVVGQIPEEKYASYLKQKTEQKFYGLKNKDINTSVRQAKKLQSLKKYFDINQITKKRKYNTLYRSYIKSLDKYLQLYAKINEADISTIENAYQQYNNFLRDQKKLNAFVKELQTPKNVLQSPNPVQLPQAASIFEENIVQQHLVAEQEHKIENLQQKNQQKKSEEQKKSSQENVNKTPKKSNKSKKKETKETKKDENGEGLSGELTEKQKINSQQKQKKDNIEQKDKKIQKKEQKTVKKNNNRSITQFFNFKKKEVQTKKPEQEVQQVIPQQQNNLIPSEVIQQPQQSTLSVWDNLQKYHKKTPRSTIQELRSQLKGFRMENEQLPNEPYYINMVITLSTIEYYDYYMKPEKEIDFTQPFTRIDHVFYFEDQSEQFQGQSASQSEEVQQEESPQNADESEGNNTIMDDDHLSFEEVSSCDSNQFEIKVQYGKGSRWQYDFNRVTSLSQHIVADFSMLCLQAEQGIPLKLDEQQQKIQFVMSPQIWRDVYKIAHGYYGTKEAIIKDILTILPGISKNWIDSMLKERSEKVGNQRFIKKDFIEDVKQKIVDIEEILQQALEERNQQLRKMKVEKNQEKDSKLQKDILQCTGSRYIVNLIKHLKQKGYKQMRRNQLIEFINQRKGQEWQVLKSQVNTMSKPIVEMIKSMQGPMGQKIDEEIQVEDEEFNKPNEENNPAQFKQDKQNIPNQKTEREKKKGGLIQKVLEFKKREMKDLSDEQIKEINEINQNGQIEQQNQVAQGKKSKQKNDDKSMKKHNKNKKIRKQRAVQIIYERPKPLKRARMTKNSLKTGIVSIDKLKQQRQKQLNQMQQKQNQEQYENANEEESKHLNQLNQEVQELEKQEQYKLFLQNENSQKVEEQKKVENDSIQKPNENNQDEEAKHTLQNIETLQPKEYITHASNVEKEQRPQKQESVDSLQNSHENPPECVDLIAESEAILTENRLE